MKKPKSNHAIIVDRDSTKSLISNERCSVGRMPTNLLAPVQEVSKRVSSKVFSKEPELANRMPNKIYTRDRNLSTRLSTIKDPQSVQRSSLERTTLALLENKISQFFFKPPPRFVFGSVAKARPLLADKTFSRSGIQYYQHDNFPFVGPASYDTEKYGTMANDMKNKALSTRGYIMNRTTPLRFDPSKDQNLQTEFNHQDFAFRKKNCIPSSHPFGSNGDRFPVERPKKYQIPGLGTYNINSKIGRHVERPRIFGGPLCDMGKPPVQNAIRRNTKKLSTSKDFRRLQLITSKMDAYSDLQD